MKIAFISFEYPPDTMDGGIATYVNQAAAMLCSRGHYVEVLAGSRYRSGVEQAGTLRVNRIQVDPEGNRQDFVKRAGQLFAERHKAVGFDVLEGPDAWAEASEAVRHVPDIPLVLKLHTPVYLHNRLNRLPLSASLRLRHRTLCWLRGRKPCWYYDSATDPDRWHALEADVIASPSKSIWDEVAPTWGLDATCAAFFPLPYTPHPNLLAITSKTNTRHTVFFGRLEVRKGVLALADAIPHVLRRHPDATFRFVGSSRPSPDPRLSMREYLERRLSPYAASVTFKDAVPSEHLASILAGAAVCALPSPWESFGFVVLDAMAAARPVVTSRKGGAAEILEHGRLGRVVDVDQPRELASAISALLADPAHCARLGEEARSVVLRDYSAQSVAVLQEASYIRAIQRRRGLGARAPGQFLAALRSQA
jgi:glycogen synthase